MESFIYDAGVELILFLQGLGRWPLVPMAIFTSLGNQAFYLLLLAILYWCINSQVGLRLGLLLMISGGINYLFKISLVSPRPYWYDARVLALSTEPTFGVPSGHAQQAVILWGMLAASARKSWAWWAAASMILLVSISRLYLGVHFPHDILLGWLIGIVLLIGFVSIEARIAGWFSNQKLWRQIVLAFIISIGLIGAALGVRLSLGDWELPEVWQQVAAQAAPDSRPLEPLSFAGVVSGSGAFFGLAAGAIWLEKKGGYSAWGTWKQRLLRLPIGTGGAGILYAGLGMLLPESGILAPILQYLLFFVLGFWFSGAAPLLFIYLRLAHKKSTIG
jgi:membrane-associated phospholipid phosphatase